MTKSGTHNRSFYITGGADDAVISTLATYISSVIDQAQLLPAGMELKQAAELIISMEKTLAAASPGMAHPVFKGSPQYCTCTMFDR